MSMTFPNYGAAWWISRWCFGLLGLQGLSLSPKELTRRMRGQTEKLFRLMVAIATGLVLGSALIGFLWLFHFKNEIILAGNPPGSTRSRSSFLSYPTQEHFPAPAPVPFRYIENVPRIPLRFEIPGTLEWVSEPNVFIPFGAVVAKLESREAYLKVQKARLAFEQGEKLSDLGTSREWLEKLKADYSHAESEIKQFFLRAPQDGVFQDPLRIPGDTVVIGTTIGYFARAIRQDEKDLR